jgi:hypothetical protein
MPLRQLRSAEPCIFCDEVLARRLQKTRSWIGLVASDGSKFKADELRKQGHEVVETKWSYAGG